MAAIFLRSGATRRRRAFPASTRAWIVAGTYVLAGLLTGISGILFAFYTNSVSPSNHGNFYELYGIAAAVLGGCSLRGGEGSIVGILIGTAPSWARLLLVLQNLVNLLGIPAARSTSPSWARSCCCGVLARPDFHALGLKFGIHIMRGIPRNSVKANEPVENSNFTAADAANTNDICQWCPDMFGVSSNAAGQAWYDSCARLWASWGVDYIKVDDLSRPYHTAEVEMVRRAIDRSGRSIVFSTSPGETPVAEANHILTHANLWRVSDDFWDNWKSLDHEFTLAARWHDFVGPGHWPDADMFVADQSRNHKTRSASPRNGYSGRRRGNLRGSLAVGILFAPVKLVWRDTSVFLARKTSAAWLRFAPRDALNSFYGLNSQFEIWTCAANAFSCAWITTCRSKKKTAKWSSPIRRASSRRCRR
jgi:hypothetical protein